MTASADRRLDLLVRVVVGLGGAVLLAAAVAAAVGPAPSWPALALVVAATLALDSVAVKVRVGHQIESYTWAELVVVIGLALLAPQHAVLTALAVGVAYAVGRRSAVKVLFNTAAYAVGLALAAGVTTLVGNPSWDRPVRSALALAAGSVAFSLWNAGSVNAAIAFSQGLPFSEVYRRHAGLRRVVMVGNTTLALGGLALAHERLPVLGALPLALALAYLGYRAYRSLLLEREVWRHLSASSHELSALDDSEIAAVAVPRVAGLLQADLVELRLSGPPGGPDLVHSGTRYGPIGVRRVRPAPPRRPADRVVVAPLTGRGGPVGELRLCFDAPVRLSDRERRLLDDYARTLGAHLDNARLYAAVSGRAASEAEAARHDPLTGLGNRLLLEERGAVTGAACAVLLIDLDRFKAVNDTYGHAAGDRLLCVLAERLRRAVRPGDTPCRLGGDEFAVLLDDPAAAVPTARRLVGVLGEPVDLGEQTVQVGASIGVAAGGEGLTFEVLMRRADQAMYRAKGQRDAYCCHEGEGEPTVVDMEGGWEPRPRRRRALAG